MLTTEAPMKVRILRTTSRPYRYVIDTEVPGQWDFSGEWNKPTYRTKEEAKEIVKQYMDSCWYPVGTEWIK